MDDLNRAAKEEEGRYYWVRLKPEWPAKGWRIGLRETHRFDGGVYEWHLFLPGREYHVYDRCVEVIGPMIRPPATTKGE